MTGGAIFIVFLGVSVLNFFALAHIITKAGYARAWILLPLTPIVCSIIIEIDVFSSLNTLFNGGSIGFSTSLSIRILSWITLITLVLNELFYLIFAFSDWPALRSRHESRKYGSLANREYGPFDRELAMVDVQNETGTTNVERRPAFVVDVPPRPVPDTIVAPVIPTSNGEDVVHCVYCGEATPGNHAFFHDCGSTDRPHLYCRKCGSQLDDTTSLCPNCAGGIDGRSPTP